MTARRAAAKRERATCGLTDEEVRTSMLASLRAQSKREKRQIPRYPSAQQNARAARIIRAARSERSS